MSVTSLFSRLYIYMIYIFKHILKQHFLIPGSACVFYSTHHNKTTVFLLHHSVASGLVLGQYQDPWQYVDDIWLMFNNAWLYNRKTSRVYKYCSKLAEVFEQEIDPVMQSLGYCCGRKVRHIFICPPIARFLTVKVDGMKLSL